MSSQDVKAKVPCTFCPKQFAKSYIKKHMKTHTDELKSKEIKNTSSSNPTEEELEYNDLEEDDDVELYETAANTSQQEVVITSVIRDIIDDAVNAQKIQIDPNPQWFMNTMSGLEEMLAEAAEDDEETFNAIHSGPAVIESDGYTCGECGKNEITK